MLKTLVSVDKLSGRELQWCFVLALGHTPSISASGAWGYMSDHGSWVEPRISREEAVNLIADHWITVERPSRGQAVPTFRCVADYAGPRKPFQHLAVVSSYSPVFEEAVIRCFVASRLGEAVALPADSETAAV